MPQALLAELVDTARKRSNGMNAQPLRYVAVRSPETVKNVAPCLHWAAKLPKAVGTVLALGYPAHKSTVVAPDTAHGLDYYVDADRNYYVPKRPLDEVATFLM